ncbi:MAG: type II toxin-antitoxin system VapC family toxin [Blastochloris sp.]|nr:type II toxin-antitoxin system VapC family toxin [Blastochloris sp.]
MTHFYADSSVLVKRHIAELGSAWVTNLCAPDQGHQVITNRLSTVEVISAFNRRLRDGTLDANDYPRMRDDFLTLCQRVYRLAPITNPLLARTRDLLERYPLRSYDAIHLASALIANETLRASGLSALTVLAADDRLLTAAQAEGFATDNPNQYP